MPPNSVFKKSIYESPVANILYKGRVQMMILMVSSWDEYRLIGNCQHPGMLMTLNLFIDYLRGYYLKPFIITITV